MCGIAGVVGEPPDAELLDRMAAVLAHRGPDGQGRLVTEQAGLAFTRLAIIDLETGDQPIHNETGTAAVVLNGEIYNHRELRGELEQRGHRFRTHSDVECVIHLWEDLGPACLERLRGMFALAIWDEPSRRLFLARDRIGKKPLYYHHLAAGGLVFGSEIKAILQHSAVSPRPDLAALDQFLTLQYVPSPMTAFAGVRRLPSAHWLSWQNGAVESGRYWRLDFEPKHTTPVPELREEVRRLLRDAVRSRLQSDVPLGVFLSGGVDSSAVALFAAEAGSHPVKTFSVGFEDAGFDESRFARRVASAIGAEHHELRIADAPVELLDDLVWHYDQPFGDSSAVPTWQIARATRADVTVVLTGDGGDEAFAGYDRYRLARYGRLFALPGPARQAGFAAVSRLPVPGRRLATLAPAGAREAYFMSLTHLAPAQKHGLYTDEFSRAAADLTSPPMAHLRSRPAGMGLLDSMLNTDMEHYLPDDLLVKVDVATMANSLEARSPFLDHHLLEFTARLPESLQHRGGRGKRLLKESLRGLLPDEVLDRPKMGFAVPLARWLRTSLRGPLEDLVTSDRALSRGYFKPAAVRRLVADHVDGGSDHRYVLWDLLMLEMWHRRFIDRAPAGSARTRPPIGASRQPGH